MVPEVVYECEIASERAQNEKWSGLMIRLSGTPTDNGPVEEDELAREAERLYLLGCVWLTNRSFELRERLLFTLFT